MSNVNVQRLNQITISLKFGMSTTTIGDLKEYIAKLESEGFTDSSKVSVSDESSSMNKCLTASRSVG